MGRCKRCLSMAAGVVLAMNTVSSAEPLDALVASSGKVTLRAGRTEIAVIQPGLFEAEWRGGSFGPAGGAVDDSALRGIIRSPSEIEVWAECRVESTDDGLRLHYVLTPRQAIVVNSCHVGVELPERQLAGRHYAIDGTPGTAPETRAGTHLSNAPTQAVMLSTTDGGEVSIQFPEPVPVLVQDNRQWGPSFSVRIGAQHVPGQGLPAGEAIVYEFVLHSPAGINVDIDRPVTITAGDEWVPLDYDVEVEPGSALDFSDMGFHDAPAGKHGWLLARPTGTFAFEDTPDVPRRFYGVNFCFSAHYLEKDEADRLAERIARMGYNTIRVHHYERMLVRESTSSSTDVKDIPVGRTPDRIEQIDRLQTPPDDGDHYGQRLRGFLHPPATGDYTFRIASDDNSELWLSATAAPEAKRRLAYVAGWTGRSEFDKYPTQVSEPVRLAAGSAYYLEVLHKEGSAGDHLTVAWEGPGVGAAGVITAPYLSTPDGKRGMVLREVWGGKGQTVVRDSTRPLPERLDQLDYFLAAFRKRGIYITTDLFVSRPVYASEIWDGAEGDCGMDEFKMAVPVNERAFENWKAFSRNLLTHRNPYTGLTYAEDPALAWLSMINEGNVGNHLGKLKGALKAEWQAEWNRWLADRYQTRAALETAWGRDAGGDPAAGGVPLSTATHEDTQIGRDVATFCAFIETRMFRRMKQFLRAELGCKALLTNMNGWTNRTATHAVRAEYDYVDDHFYVDHPRFLQKRWQLPSACPNTSPIRARAPGGRGNCFVSHLGKPFTISEYNYSGPGRFRGVGGILTGCLGALQGWDVIWRFGYSHHRGNLFQPSPAGYFDMVTDPLNQVADRAALCLYLRGDLREAPHTVAIAVDPEDLREGAVPNRGAAPEWSEMAWITKVRTALVSDAERIPADLVLALGPRARERVAAAGLDADAYAGQTGQRIVAAMQERGWLPATDPGKWRDLLRSETGELSIDSARDVLVLDTPRTAGGYAPQGEVIETEAVTVRMDETYATVWVSSIDGEAIAASKRMILCHLTDLQNTGARFGERARKTLYAWGGLPHLVRAGTATVRIRMARADQATVYALSTSGTRLHHVDTSVENGELVVKPTVRGPDGTARMVYEVVVE